MKFSKCDAEKVLGALDVPVIVVDRDYNVIFSNIPIKKGKCYQIFHKYPRPCHTVGEECPLKHVLSTGKSTRVLHVHSKNDENIFVEVYGAPLYKNGEILGMVEAIFDVTARVKAENEIKELKDELERIYNSVPDIIAIIDKNFNIKKINRAGELLFGMKKDEICKHKCYELFHKNGKKIEECPHEKLLRDGKCHFAEIYEKKFDRYFLVSTSPIISKNGEIEGSVHVVRDITPIKELQLRLNSVIQNANDAIILVDEGGRILLWNKSAEDIFGYKTEEIVGEKISRVFPEYYSWKKDRFESALTRKDGTFVDCEISLSTWEFMGEEYTTLIIRDISWRKTLENRILDVYEHSPVGIMVLNNYIIEYANPVIEKYSGLSRDKLLGKKCYSVLMKRKTPCDGCLVEDVVKDKQPRSRIKHAFSPLGQEIYVNQIWYPLLDSKGNIEGIVEVAIDVTHQKKLEVITELFMDILHHDIINPLSIALSYAELMISEENNDEKLEMLKSIKENIERAIEIADASRFFTHLRNMDTIKKEKIDLKEIIEKAISELKTQIENANMIIENRIKYKMPVKANSIIIHVFLNLISNAIKYASKGKKIIIDGEKHNGFYRIKVIDFGPGIEDKYKKAIFERFRRKEKGGVRGTGLGLAIAKRITELHQGKIWVEDNPKGGAVFVVEIPEN